MIIELSIDVKNFVPDIRHSMNSFYQGHDDILETIKVSGQNEAATCRCNVGLYR